MLTLPTQTIYSLLTTESLLAFIQSASEIQLKPMLAIMKSIWTAAIPVYLRKIVYADLHTHMKTAAQTLFI